MIDKDQSFGPAKIKPTSVLDTIIAVPTMLIAGVSLPSNATEAAILSLDYDRSVQFAAAYLKGLADLRMGDTPGSRNSRTSDMLKVDMQIVRSAYTMGLKPFMDRSNGTLEYYQTSTYIAPGGAGEEASPWLDAFEEIYGP